MMNKSLKDKKLISEKLRIENKKMEVRLQQLKLTMNKEKEERISSGNSTMWSNGAPGTMLNYKPTLVAIDRTKKVKLKILKEEDDEIVLHDVKGQLQRQNVKPIFNGDTLSNGDKIYSREDSYGRKMKCGQCEESLAAVNCKECTEVYCAKCFAAFHLKGALRKHRSTPISNLSNRVSIPSPLFNAPNFNNSYRNGNNKQKKETEYIATNLNRKDSKENQPQRSDNLSLGNGEYDEGLSTQYFQDALLAWRNNEDPPFKPAITPFISKTEHSTETTSSDVQKKVLADSIHFTPSLSYAEQLLLRKHRSCQLEPVEMKYVLNRLARNNDEELLENQRLLQSNFELETAAINSGINCGLVADTFHVNIESLSNLWSEAALLSEREPLKDNTRLVNTQFEIKEVIPYSDDSAYEEEIPRKSENNQHNSVTMCNNEEIKINIAENQDNFLNERYSTELSQSKINPKRPHSAIHRSEFNERPQSARKMSARNIKGGVITTKPSVLLDILASFNEYLPCNTSEPSDISPKLRSNSASTVRSKSKLNFNFYKTAPQSWKPALAWSEKESVIEFEKESKPINYGELEETEYEEELKKLNFFSNNSNSREVLSNDHIETSSSNSEISIIEGHNDDACDYDEEEEEALEQLQSFERELTLISRKESVLSNRGDYEEILVDSLDFENPRDSLDLLESDKFNLEDSLDFQHRSSNHSQMMGDDDDEDMGNCSSRFNDYEDVHDLN